MTGNGTYEIEDLKKALEVFNAAYKAAHQANDTKKSFYCGITHDLDERQKGHKNPNYVTTVKCDSFKTAKELEQMLHDNGFDTGEQVGNGTEKSVFVYMYRKIPQVTNESLCQSGEVVES